ncbi:hypothetical protein AGMMS4952_12010 [Spirochaetia bacterium]|nr:hypothetical protein AGMMS4952_12010 [Spirochaetia bacterium]
MKSICPVVLGFFLITLSSCATAPAAKAIEESSVWQISKGENTVYLGGSVHMVPKKTKTPGAFNKAFGLSDVAVFEADVLALEKNPVFIKSLQSKMFLPEGQTLKTVLSGESYQKLSGACTGLGVSITQVEQMKPSMVVNLLSALQLQKYGITETGVDVYYMKLAKKKHKTMLFLESVDFQIDLLLSMFDENIDEYISYSVADLEQDSDAVKTEIENMLHDWIHGRNEYIVELNSTMKADYPSVYDGLLKDRNNTWVPIIEGYLEDAPVEFIIVGLAHIHGEDGLLKQLAEAGYLINPLR